jgi:hypothetical protein
VNGEAALLGYRIAVLPARKLDQLLPLLGIDERTDVDSLVLRFSAAWLMTRA